MTKLRNDPKSISNYYDDLLKDIGHRGSSFTDVDWFNQSQGAVPPLYYTHDGYTQRFLWFELKNEHEKLSGSARWALRDFSKKPGCEGWVIRRMPDGHEIVLFKNGLQSIGNYSDDDLRALYRAWWNSGREARK